MKNRLAIILAPKKYSRSRRLNMDNKAFDYKRIAMGYKNRPFLHGQVMDKLQEDIGERQYVNGLDVGCGAGLSTKALKLLCKHVTGTDISNEMIEIAREVCYGADFFTSQAEEIPIPTHQYDIVTAAGVIQWVEQEAFLKKMQQILEKKGVLAIYDFCISDKMIGKEAYTEWWHQKYLKNFPKPKRNEHVWTNEEVSKYGFQMYKQIKFELTYEFTLSTFIEFMLIQSNVNSKIEGEGQDINTIREWFGESLKEIFEGRPQTLIFEGYSWYIISQ